MNFYIVRLSRFMLLSLVSSVASWRLFADLQVHVWLAFLSFQIQILILIYSELFDNLMSLNFVVWYWTSIRVRFSVQHRPHKLSSSYLQFFFIWLLVFCVYLLDHLDTKQILYVACACVVFRPGQCLVLESIECVFVICKFGLTKQQLGVHGHLWFASCLFSS